MSTQTTQLDWREGRRRRAWELKQQGWKQQDIAASLGVTPDIAQAPSASGSSGRATAAWRRCDGAQPKLNAVQLAQLRALLERGAEAYGFSGQVWTCKRVVDVIPRTFGVTYHSAHVSRLLHALRHSVPRPVARATQRDEATITAWWRERWPTLENKPPSKGAPSSG